MRSRFLSVGTVSALALGLFAAPAAAPLPVAADYAQAAAAMTAAGEPFAGWAADGRRFLLFDPSGDGFAVEILGDLSTADRVAVLVPGVGTNLADFDRGLGGVARRAPAVQARQLSAELQRRSPHARVAVVAWLGYDPPNGWGLDVATESRAAAGAAALTRFVGRLVHERPAPAITLIGHSYGSTVLGLAASKLPAQVGDLVAIGSPGMGHDHVGDLGTGARVWAAEAATDWIRRVPGVRVLGLGHGTRPGTVGFGARLLPTGGVRGHDGYLESGSATLTALAEVVLGTADATAEDWGGRRESAPSRRLGRRGRPDLGRPSFTSYGGAFNAGHGRWFRAPDHP
ncbi:alpha/beta hydrolase [Catellatospora sichuanensis]|uniref:alpha/beta hydrolase n=1 Tax=Catellatospora sichuanensis TaxID=1969805 RepID=UPI001182FEEF|nr:alpha/beta hydrolase [Catellatospora sichuanensis]